MVQEKGGGGGRLTYGENREKRDIDDLQARKHNGIDRMRDSCAKRLQVITGVMHGAEPYAHSNPAGAQLHESHEGRAALSSLA